MPYAEGRIYQDADAHIVETPEWLLEYADAATREQMKPLYVARVEPGEESFIEELRRAHRSPEYRAREEAEIMLR